MNTPNPEPKPINRNDPWFRWEGVPTPEPIVNHGPEVLYPLPAKDTTKIIEVNLSQLEQKVIGTLGVPAAALMRGEPVVTAVQAPTALEGRLRTVLHNHRYQSLSGRGSRGLMQHHIDALTSDLLPFVKSELDRATDEAVVNADDLRALRDLLREQAKEMALVRRGSIYSSALGEEDSRTMKETTCRKYAAILDRLLGEDA